MSATPTPEQRPEHEYAYKEEEQHHEGHHPPESPARSLGRGVIRAGDDLTLGLYSAERSLIDMVRLRHREGTEIAWEALRHWLRRNDARPAALLEMARSFHGAQSAVHHALEVVL